MVAAAGGGKVVGQKIDGSMIDSGSVIAQYQARAELGTCGTDSNINSEIYDSQTPFLL